MTRFHHSRRIHVEYVDQETNRVVACSDLRSNELELQARVVIGDDHWVVVGADPGGAEEAVEQGALRVTLRRVVDIDTQDLLFSAPTLANRVPALAKGTQRKGRVMNISEDGWRQAELVALDHETAIETCLDHIREVLAQERASVGWRRLHIRDQIPDAPILPQQLAVGRLHDRLNDLVVCEGLSFPGVTALIAYGFGCRTRSGIELYGLFRERRIEVLGLQGWGEGVFVDSDARALALLAEEHHLGLVDWCRGVLLRPSQFPAWFASRS